VTEVQKPSDFLGSLHVTIRSGAEDGKCTFPQAQGCALKLARRTEKG
jgi:hypothetical protein